MNTDEIIDGIILREGGFVDHPADKGGPTKFGITHAALSQWRKQPVTLEDVQNLLEAEAREIYWAQYVVAPGFHDIVNDQLRSLMVDMGVNHGPVSAIAMMQRALHVVDDGVFGAKTWEALAAANVVTLYRGVVAERAVFYGKLISKSHKKLLQAASGKDLPEDVETAIKKHQAVFAHGWAERLAEFARDGPS